MQYSFTAQHIHIEDALAEGARHFDVLEREIRAFTPRSLDDFAAERERRLQHMLQLNPTSSVEDITHLVDQQFQFVSSPEYQVLNKFYNRWAAAHITLTTLSHALCEASINASLALLMAHRELAQTFPLVERSPLKKKWTLAPKLLEPSYELPADSVLVRDLSQLIADRNALAHSKISLNYNGKDVLKGEEAHISLDGESADRLWRFAALPYKLQSHLEERLRTTENFFAVRGLLHRRAPERSAGSDAGNSSRAP